MKNLFFTILILGTAFCSAQQKELIDNKTQEVILMGVVNREKLLQEPYNSWFTPNYNSYVTDKEVMEKLSPLLKDVFLKVYLGFNHEKFLFRYANLGNPNVLSPTKRTY